METHVTCDNLLVMTPVGSAELTRIEGGVGPNFDVSKVEGYKKPSWYLPLDPRLVLSIR
jgi:hypothetical protein